MNIKVVIALHKPYPVPKDDIYLPLHVGKKGKESFGLQGDDTGDNISEKNSVYNELTGVYWAWKNLKADYVGLVHYRRYFSAKGGHKKSGADAVAAYADFEPLLKRHDIILPKKRRYYIETVYSHYVHLPYVIPSDLEQLQNVIQEICPEYMPALERMLNRRWAHMFNMFVMKWEVFDRYCEWAFRILNELDHRIDMSGRKPMEARYYISEFLLDTWIDTNHLDYKEMKVIFIEGENMMRKTWTAVKRKMGINRNEKKVYTRI